MSIVQTLVPKFLAVQISSYSRLSNLLPRSFCNTIREHARPQSQSDLCRTWGSSICRRDISLRNRLKYISNCSGKSCTIRQHNRMNQANINVVFFRQSGNPFGLIQFRTCCLQTNVTSIHPYYDIRAKSHHHQGDRVRVRHHQH